MILGWEAVRCVALGYDFPRINIHSKERKNEAGGKKERPQVTKETSQTPVVLKGMISCKSAQSAWTGSHQHGFGIGFWFIPTKNGDIQTTSALFMQWMCNWALEGHTTACENSGMGGVHGLYCKPILKQCVLEQTAKHFLQSIHGRFVNSKMCLLQDLVASISLPGSQASRDPWNSRWLDKHLLLPQNNNHWVKLRPWPALQIWAAALSVSVVGSLDGHGSKSSFFGWLGFGSSGKSGSFLLPLLFCFTFAWSGNTCFKRGGRCSENWMQNWVRIFPWNYFSW